MNKKFVKSQMFNSDKYTQKPQKFQKYSNPPPQRPKRHNRQYAEKLDVIDLRKYFQIVPTTTNPKFKELIERFPNFFNQASSNYEVANGKYQGRSEKIVFAAEPADQQICSWDSEGEVDLGVGVIDKSIVKKFDGIAPLKINQLKRHERDFLEDELRKKQVEDKSENVQANGKTKNEVKQTPAAQNVNKPQVKFQVPPKQVQAAKVSSEQSDQEIQMVKTTQYEAHHAPEAQIYPSSSQPEQQIKTQSEGCSNRFKDSQGSDDIFGDNQNTIQEKQSEDSVPKVSNGRGFVEFAKGEFGIFALGQGLKPDDEVWAFSDGSTVSKKFSSTEMDRDYRKQHYSTYPLITFNEYPVYVDYQTFSQHPNVELFIQNNQLSNNYDHKFTQGKAGRRKYSSNNYQEQDNINHNNKQRNRRQSTAQYRPKKNDFI